MKCAHDRFGPLDVRDVAGAAEEGGLLEKVRALLLAQVDVDLLEVAAAVVAGDAGEIDAEEDLAEQNRQFVVGVDLMNLPQVVAGPTCPGLPSTCSRTMGLTEATTKLLLAEPAMRERAKSS